MEQQCIHQDITQNMNCRPQERQQNCNFGYNTIFVTYPTAHLADNRLLTSTPIGSVVQLVQQPSLWKQLQ